jgi:two-component system, NtrC family, response regulator AtoC
MSNQKPPMFVEQADTELIKPRTRGDWEVAVVHEEGRLERAAKAGSVLMIGRNATNDLPIDHPSISRQHARLVLADRVTIEDLGSSNGTRVDGLLIPKGQPSYVRTGSVIEVGTVMILLRAPTESAEEFQPPPGCSVDMMRAFELANAASKSALNVLVIGEPGAGKAWLAQWLVARSPRASGPLVVHRAQGDESDLAELTGASAHLPGSLERAHRGSCLLRGVEELTAAAQTALLKMIDQKSITRADGSVFASPDLRVLVTSTLSPKDLRARLVPGLADRLLGITIEVAPLRTRKGELRYIASSLLSELPKAPKLGDRALGELLGYPWSGNIRELRDVLLRAGNLAGDAEVRPQHLGLSSAPDDERSRILTALETAAGNQTRAAEILGISRRTLVNRLNEMNLPRPRKGREE